MQRQISLDAISEATRIPVNLLAGLECNDLTDWPEGLFARAYVRQYAIAIRVDPDATIDEFCRWFLEGDRRAERTIREHAAIVGHDLQLQDEGAPDGIERRNVTAPRPKAQAPSPLSALFIRVRRGFHKASS
jgi:hypothetical protein